MRLVKSWNSEELERRYQESFGVDISRFVNEKQIELLEDAEVGIQYFKGCDPGDDAFYSQLSKQPWYYMADKWEHASAVKTLCSLNKDAFVLDIGCSGGEFLEQAREAGFIRIAGLEFNGNALRLCRDKGIPVHSVSTSDFVQTGKKFDFITAFQVLEHVADPDQFLKEISALINTNGIVILSTPNRKSFTKRIGWNLLDMPPHHLTRWDSDSFAKAGKKHGLILTSVHIEPLASYHRSLFLSSFLDWVPNFLKVRSALNILVSAVPLPDTIRRKITGHTLLAVLRKAEI